MKGFVKVRPIKEFIVSYPDPDSIRSVDQYPDSESGSGSGSRKEKITHKNRKKLGSFVLLSAGCSLFRAEGYSCSLDVFYGALGISNLQFLIKKNIGLIFFSCKFLSKFLVIKILDPDLIWIRIGIQPKMLDPDSMNPDPKHIWN